MNKEQISEIAQAIVNEEILSNWQFYILIILLSLIGSYAAHFVISYAKKRGEHLATKADIDEIKAQLTTTTEITEKIRNDIEHKVWRKQQVEIIKREKLEEYLQYIYIAQDNLSREMSNKYFNSNEVVDTHAMSKATMLRKLYFPELRVEHAVFLKAHSGFQLWMVDGMNELAQKRSNGEKLPIISSEHMKKYTDLLKGLNSGNILVESKAEEISGEINAA